MSATPTAARGVLTTLIVIGAATSAASLTFVARGEAIAQEKFLDAMLIVAQLYAPLLGVFIAFHFPAGPPRQTTDRPVPATPLFLAAVLIGVYAFAPVLLLLVITDIESIVVLLRRLSPVGQVVSSGILAFFFSRY